MCAGRDGFVAIYSSWADDSDWRLLLLHYAALHGTCVSSEDDVWARFNEEGVLHIACGMIVGEVH